MADRSRSPPAMRRASARTSLLRPALLPYPAKLELAAPGAAPFQIHPGTSLFVAQGVAQDDPAVIGMKALVAKVTGTECTINARAAGDSGSISMRLIDPLSMGPEAYNLRIVEKAVELEASAAPGLFYGVQTLRQLASNKAGGTDVVEWPSLTISDAPRFGWRGLHMDVSRHFFDAEKVKKHLDVMAMFKLNRFHWHLTDDQGWRLPVDGYPKLTEVGGHGKAYTKQEIKDVVAYAKARHIEVIPEIDVPGHVEAVLASYPELGNADVPGRTAPAAPRIAWGISEYTLAPSEATWTFLDRVFDTVVELFPSQFVHMGGDEVITKEWSQSPAAQAVLETPASKVEEAKDPGQRVGELFTKRLNEILKAKGRRVVAWNEAQHNATFPQDAVVMAWRAADEVLVALKAGRQCVVAPEEVYYFDFGQAVQGEPKSATRDPEICWTSWQHVYAFEPMPKYLTEAQEKLVLGIQGQLWTEYMPTWEHFEYMAHPRSMALAERAWTPSANVYGFEEFEERLQERLGDLDQKGVNYRRLRR